MKEFEKTIAYRVVSEAIIGIHKEKIRILSDLLWTKQPSEISFCKKCGYVSDNEDFNFPTGGGDYYIECPSCHAPENFIVGVEEFTNMGGR
jgi:hypothetical protein